MTGVDEDSATEAKVVGGGLMLLLALFLIHLRVTAFEARRHPPQSTRLVEYEFPMEFPTVRVFVTQHVDFDIAPFEVPAPNCTFQEKPIHVTKYCCKEMSTTSTTEEPEEPEETEDPYEPEETEEPETSERPQRRLRRARRAQNKPTTTAKPIPCVQPPEPIDCLGEMLHITNLTMTSFEDSLACDFMLEDSGIARIDFCPENCESMQISPTARHWIQEDRLYWLQFSFERHTFLDDDKPERAHLDVSQMFLDPDFDEYENRMQFQLQAKSESYILVSEQDPVHSSQQLASIMACSSFLYMIFNLCFALPFRKRFRCKCSEEVIDYRSLALVTSPRSLSMRLSNAEAGSGWNGAAARDQDLDPIHLS